MSPCQACSRPVTQLYLCPRSLPTTPGHVGPAPVNLAAHQTLLTAVLANATSQEPALTSDYRHLNPHYSQAQARLRAHLSHPDDSAHLCYSCNRSAMRFRRRHGVAGSILTDTSCDLLDYRSIFQARPPALPPVPPGTAPPTLDPYSRDDWRGTALLSDDYVFVVITLLPDANDHTQRNVLARLLGDSEGTPPTAPPGDVDDTSRCTLFPLSEARAASDTFQASGLALAWSAALSLPRRGPPRLDPTPISELLDTRNALRTRNRELSGLTATPSLPPSSNRRPRSPLLPPPLSQAARPLSPPRSPSPPLSTSDVHSVHSEARGDSYFDDSDEASQATPSHASLSSSFSPPSVGNSDVHTSQRRRTRRRPSDRLSHRKRHLQ